MEEIFMKGGSNIAIKKNNDQFYYFRMFDVKMSATDIKKRYEWQAYKKIPKVYLEKKDFEVTKAFNLKFGGHFSNYIKINKIKYILIYFNNENDTLNTIYKSNMEDNIGEGFKLKSQDELIGENGMYKKRFSINRFKLPQQTKKDKFVDAKSDLISTIPRTQEEHEELDNLNKNFKERLEELDKDKESSMSIPKGKRKLWILQMMMLKKKLI
ncbi:hypothetical protein RhiirA5_424985 [Rhizophagus irregularis]|uniref:Uncharacterized protein n=1 Tax=Rhizophagus irregularis TaxID=588596 RepID=A0A2N0P735_9GLOM|nr:hypothetical protein RhiirA5_424985 [Rhizophagus irregularis]